MKREVEVFLDENAASIWVGTLWYSKEGQREICQFRYSQEWLDSPRFYELSPDLGRSADFMSKTKKREGSVFFDCFADTEPNGWGRKLIVRDHAVQRREGGAVAASLDALDFLLWTDDFSRQGALRFRDSSGVFCRETPPERRKTPPVLDLRQLTSSVRAVELSQETLKDLEFLRGRGSDLDGMRPKCSVIDVDGSLCVAKFPSVSDDRSIVGAEALAITLAKRSGIQTPPARIVDSDGVPVLLVRRFDRSGDARRMYLSAASMLGDFMGNEEHAYTEMADVLRRVGAHPDRDVEDLWRRMAFNILIRNVDDHLHNHGFLHVSNGQWDLSPVFDVNPFPEKAHVLKLWVSEDSGPSGRIEDAICAAGRFGLADETVKAVLCEIVAALHDWKKVAALCGLRKKDADALREAFEHEQMSEAQRYCAPTVSMSSRPKG